MRGRLVLVLLFVSVYTAFGQNAWKKSGIILDPPVCYASDEIHSSFIEPPREYYERLKSASTQKANIEVTYTGFSNEAMQAFEYAVSIWESLIYSPVTIRIKANFTSLAKGTLGSCGPTVYYKNFNSTQKINTYYPVALVEKMLGEEVNGVNQFDIVGNFNKDFTNWYFGTDGKTPAFKYDFVSTVLHELAHGLGFAGNLDSQSGKGGYSYNYEMLAGIFDSFITDKNGNKLVKTSIYPNPSVALHQGLTSGFLEFATKLSGNEIPRLYAPATWDGGSSVYHLDETTYAASDTNSLMTPFAASGEAVHTPGPNSLAIMYEMGWKSISVKHKPLKDIEFVSGPIDFSAEIKSDYDLDSTKLYLVYSGNRFLKSDSVLLKPTDISANFSARLSNIQSSSLSYFFSVTDVMNRRFVYPSNAPANNLSFKIGIDKTPPVVAHEAIKYMLVSENSVKINAEVTDNIGIKSARVEYFINGGLIQTVLMQNEANDTFTGNLAFPSGTLKDGDKISYRIAATDVSSQSNVGRSPESGYNIFYIQGIQAPVERYVNNFDTETNDFIGSDFNVSKVTGFDSPALNSAHPYLSPDTDDTNFNFIAILKYPIILKMGGKMSFDEVVLVEPGETGTKFGDEEFWDYVIVEGSKDGGTNWKPLINGYDSNAQKTWYLLFINSTSGQNSTGVPTKSLFVKREFELLANGNFQAGDTIQVRFRLFSDPYSHGWGWIIDNLAIQDYKTDANSLAISEGEVSFFPNPASDRLNLQLQTKNTIGNLVLKAFNSSGKLVYNQQFKVGSTEFQTSVDLANYIPGLYLFSLEYGSEKAITRKILVR
ncbi:MAG: hypothetical protein A2066_16705 [Bacteroidetes bacterium GWB2_41_8]|nr:MAG: hypothetical protein A2066_16705 [Bacteroidetes bacterium GWB2_41_8]